jgi:hypothetical protein
MMLKRRHLFVAAVIAVRNPSGSIDLARSDTSAQLSTGSTNRHVAFEARQTAKRVWNYFSITVRWSALRYDHRLLSASLSG